MKRLEQYFKEAMVCDPDERKVGLEVENLIVNGFDQEPISLRDSQAVFEALVDLHDWQILEKKNGIVTALSKEGGRICYELGWSNIELATRPYLSDKSGIVYELGRAMRELGSACNVVNGVVSEWTYLDCSTNTLVMPDERDRIWLELDGPALEPLGLIAAVHLNIELSSIKEGMEWIRLLNQRYFKPGKAPATRNCITWQKYIQDSWAGYESNRYGPAPENWPEYLEALSGFKVVMNQNGDGLYRVNRPFSFRDSKEVDIDLYLRSVWWWSRLRVRQGQLVLEIREIPRNVPIDQSLDKIFNILNI